ncbi:MAG: M28 family metallopeptidase [Promethearchaeota archaeon]
MKSDDITADNLFDADRLHSYVKSFSFPRLVGTEGEHKAVRLTIETFQNIGFKDTQIYKESFKFSDFYSTTLIKLIMVINLTFSLFLLMFIYVNLTLTFLIVGIMTIVVVLIIKGLKHPENPGFWGEYYGKSISGTNVFTKINAKSLDTNSAGDIIISAHLDSKSQTFKTSWRVVLYRLWLYSGIFLGGFLIALIIYVYTPIKLNLLIISIGIWIFTILISISNTLLLFLNTHNRSPGALDNASGMAIVFELSKFFMVKKLHNFNLWFIQFSGEELGTMGSRIFLNEHEGQFTKGRIFHLNFEMVSCVGSQRNNIEYLKSIGVYPRKKVAPLLSQYLDEAADFEGIKLKGFHLSTGAHTDSVPFHLRGYDSIDIITRAGARYTHSKMDTPDKVDPQKLVEACLIIRRTILKIDNDYKI